jgi:hypothetical protein
MVKGKRGKVLVAVLVTRYRGTRPQAMTAFPALFLNDRGY